MSEPLYFRSRFISPDVPPPSFRTTVTVHSEPADNFELAKQELSKLFGAGFEGRPWSTRDEMLVWNWEPGLGEVKITATIKHGPPSSDSRRSWVGKKLRPSPVKPPPSECTLEISPKWLPVASPEERRLVNGFTPFELALNGKPKGEPDPEEIKYGMRRMGTSDGGAVRGVGLSADGSTFVNTTIKDRVVLFPREDLRGVKLHKEVPEKAAAWCAVSLLVQQPSGVGSHRLCQGIGTDVLDGYARSLASLLKLELTESEWPER